MKLDQEITEKCSRIVNEMFANTNCLWIELRFEDNYNSATLKIVARFDPVPADMDLMNVIKRPIVETVAQAAEKGYNTLHTDSK